MSDFHFVRREQIHEGWSEDRKYCAIEEDGTRYLLRISPIEQYERKHAEFRMMEQAAALGIPMCLPLEFGVCDKGVYSVQSWIEGVDARDTIPNLSDTRQYVYGLEAGRILRKIHSLPVPGMDSGAAGEGQPEVGEDSSSRAASPECDGKSAQESGVDEDSSPAGAGSDGKSTQESGVDEDSSRPAGTGSDGKSAQESGVDESSSRPGCADSGRKSAQESGLDESSRRPVDAGGEGKSAREAVVGKKGNRADVSGGKVLEDWETRFGRKMDRKIKSYRECPLQYEGGENFIRYIEENRHLLKGRPQGYQHGDYHIGNMMLDREGRLQVIDFNRFDFGDPWEEFNRIVWCAQASPLFASGMVNGYFDGRVPEEFWRLLALYIVSNTLSSLPWAVPFGQEEVDTMRSQAAEVLSWYDNMSRVIPSWYFEGYYL